jgi:hypothetical protein
MKEATLHARLLTAGGELLAEGACRIEAGAARATLEPVREPGLIRKARGVLRLELEDGRTLAVSDRAMVVRVWDSARPNGRHERRTMYLLRLLDGAQEATAVDVAGDGTPAGQEALPPNAETSAAR